MFVAAALLAAISPALAAAQTPPPGAIDVKALQPKELFPKTKLHTEFVVEVNKMGQVARVRSGKSCNYPPFNAQTYGNALQTFIRTPDGHAVSGLYRLSYDYDPSSQRVRRDVALVHAGGVNPNAHGAVNDMNDIARRNAKKHPQQAAAAAGPPRPAPSVNATRLPDLPQVMKTPSHP